MYIDIADIEGYSTAAQIEIPHADKFFTFICGYLGANLLEIMLLHQLHLQLLD